MSSGQIAMNVEAAVKERYNAAAKEKDASLCCPVTYDSAYLKVIPKEILERDYGCGDPSRHVRPGDTVLDLGSGGGKMCFIVSQIVGPKGRVIGVDMNDEMLALARKHRDAVGRAIGWHNIDFRKGRIQDLALDLDHVDKELKREPIATAAGFFEMENHFAQLRHEAPMIPSQSIDVVISNCVLNLVDPAAKTQLFAEIFRVLRIGGRAVISDIVSDKPVPAALMQNPTLWSGCISGALTETGFAEAFRRAGFEQVATRQRQEKPWRVLEGVEFRAITVEALKEHAAAAPSRAFSLLPGLSQRSKPTSPPTFANSDSCCGDTRCC